MAVKIVDVTKESGDFFGLVDSVLVVVFGGDYNDMDNSWLLFTTLNCNRNGWRGGRVARDTIAGMEEGCAYAGDDLIAGLSEE